MSGLRRRRVHARSRSAVVRLGLGLGLAGGLALASVGARAEGGAPEPARAAFALIIGVNASPAPDRSPLRYADDDAARYLELFRALGARTYILSRLDDNTRRLHPQAVAEALPPRREELAQAIASLARDVAQARARGVKSTLYVLYAGHGDVSESGWSLTLEDGRLDGTTLLSEVVERSGAEQVHVIVDACQAYLLALPRGPGGSRRPARGFVALEAASRTGRVGYLLSSSASGDSHEWAGFEAGVFSHEVRSGLFGAADADGDGRVTYPEIAAFVARANAGITAERFRPQVYARAPRDGDVLLDLRARRDSGLRLEGPTGAAHHLLEDTRGVRLLDFHGDGVTPVHLIRPPGDGPLYLRRVADNTEQSVPRAPGLVRLESLPRIAAHEQSRGAAQDAFNQLFAVAFDGGAVADWAQRADQEHALIEAAARRQQADLDSARRRDILGKTALGVGIAAGLTAGLVELSAHRLHEDALPYESQRDAVARNDTITARNRLAAGLTIGAAAAIGASLWLLWPKRDQSAGAEPSFSFAGSPAGAAIEAKWRF